MSRIRSIHPGIFTDEAFMTLTVESPLAIAFMLGLWVEADDAGIFEWKLISLKAKILPAASADVCDLLAALQHVNMIMKVEAEGKNYGVIRNFAKYQRPKDPKLVHPLTDEMRIFAGFLPNGERPNATRGRKPMGVNEADFGSNSELPPNDFGSHSEKLAQREDEGGRREDEKEIIISPPKRRKKASDLDPSIYAVLSETLSPASVTSLADWRCKKKAPLTELAAKELISEFKKFGDPEQALAIMQMRGWAGFEAKWLLNSAREGSRPRVMAFETSKPAANF